jgi:hypothetical protein
MSPYLRKKAVLKRTCARPRCGGEFETRKTNKLYCCAECQRLESFRLYWQRRRARERQDIGQAGIPA